MVKIYSRNFKRLRRIFLKWYEQFSQKKKTKVRITIRNLHTTTRIQLRMQVRVYTKIIHNGSSLIGTP